MMIKINISKEVKEFMAYGLAAGGGLVGGLWIADKVTKGIDSIYNGIKKAVTSAVDKAKTNKQSKES